jgi:hypothetical protein
MKKNIIKLLKAADDPENCEYPRDFDWLAAMSRVIDLKPDLDRIVGQPFEINDRIFNASFFVELVIKELKPIKVFNLGEVTLKVVCLRFSCFGNFFTITEESLTDILSRSVIKDLITAAEARGFVYIDEEILLNEPYTGCNKELKDLASWWERYFDYI